MTLQISQLPEELAIDENISLYLKTSNSYEEFVQVMAENIEHLSRWLPWAKSPPDESSIEHYSQAQAKKQNNESVDWDIYAGDELVGAVGVMQRDPDRVVLEIGYWLIERQTGKGIITKCVNKIVDLLFNEIEAPLIEIGADFKNNKSRAVPERCGFQLDREFTDNQNAPQIEHGVYYSLTRKQWEEKLSE